MIPSTEALRCFHAAAKTLHFRSAARSVALTPSAFGHRIRQLEAELGEPIRLRVLAGAGIAVLPAYMIAEDLQTRRLRVLFPNVRLLEDHLRFVFRADDARRPVFEAIARSMSVVPLT